MLCWKQKQTRTSQAQCTPTPSLRKAQSWAAPAQLNAPPGNGDEVFSVPQRHGASTVLFSLSLSQLLSDKLHHNQFVLVFSSVSLLPFEKNEKAEEPLKPQLLSLNQHQ